MTWPPCHPDISGYGIYDLVIIPPTGYQVVPIVPGPTGGTWQGRLLWAISLLGINLGPAADQSDDRLGEGRVVRLRLGRLLAFDTADCLGAIGRTSAQLGPPAAQSVHLFLERLLPLRLA